MRSNRRYLVAVALLAVLAVVFGLAGTVAPPLDEGSGPEAQQGLSSDSSSSSSSVGHFQNPPTYDSGWVDITDKCGQYINLKHNLNTTNVFVDIAGKQSLGLTFPAWNKTYGGNVGAEPAYCVIQTSDGGYALAGSTLSLFPSNYQIWLVKTDPAGNMLWSKTYGSTDRDEIAYCVIQTSDGGYALAGFSSVNARDFYLVKTDANGTLVWQRFYGGTGSEVAYSVVQTSDGYALAGYTFSYGEGTPTCSNAWLVKTDASGFVQWSNPYGGAGNDEARSIVQTSDGYALAGYTFSYGEGTPTCSNAWLVKTDASGFVQWSNPYGGADFDCAYSLVHTSNGGYAFAGYTNSSGAGGWDFWLVKTYSAGDVQWSETYGGANDDIGHSLVQTTDGGYAIAGETDSFGAGDFDFWFVRTDPSGDHLWNMTRGGEYSDIAYSLVHTDDGGYAIAGITYSYGAGGGDFWLVKLTPMGGALAWSKKYAGGHQDYAYSVVQTADGGYAFAGYMTPLGRTDSDFYLVKTDASGTVLWSQAYGGAEYDYCQSVVQTTDGGYALAGRTNSSGAGGYDFWLIKTDSAGNMLWSQTYGGTYDDWGWSMVQTSEGGYAIAGYTYSFGLGTPTHSNAWLVKTDASGNQLWAEAYGGAYNDVAYSMAQTMDGGYALAGREGVNAFTNYPWLIKTDASGTLIWSKSLESRAVAYSVVQTSDGGYALGGSCFILGSSDHNFWLAKTDPNGNLQWNQTYGGANDDVCHSVIQTDDGGYTLAGNTYSFGAGSDDFWLVKTDSVGSMLWSKTYGGTNHDGAASMVRTTDGGYALAGWTGGLGGVSAGFCLVKVKPEMYFEHQRNIGLTGTDAGWSKTYGGVGTDRADSLIQTADGGYALAGYTDSFGAGLIDFYLVKTDSCGCVELLRTYGGAGYDWCHSVVQTADGGYALAGDTDSFGAGGYDFWLVKTDSAGNVLWSQTYGGTGSDGADSVVQTSDGGYALVGTTCPYGAFYTDLLLVKTDASGNMLWSKTYGGSLSDGASSLVQTTDGGYALGGYTEKSSGAGGYDFWLVKTDATGNMQWSRTYGGAGFDVAHSLVQTSDCGGYALAGSTTSFGAGADDIWLVRTDASGNMLWSKTYGGRLNDGCSSVVQTDDCGYALAGWINVEIPSAASANSMDQTGDGEHTFADYANIIFADFWLVKTDPTGTVQWSKTYGGTDHDFCNSVVQTADGGYALAGDTDSYGAGNFDFWLVKTDVEMGLARTGLTQNSITLYRGKTDLDWNYVRVRIWTIKEPTWVFGDIDMDGYVGYSDFIILAGNYGKTFSLFSLGGIAAIAGIRVYKKRKQDS